MRVRLLKILFLLCAVTDASAQDTSYSNRSFNPGIALGINAGDHEMGVGSMMTFSMEYGVWKEDRLRLKPELMAGTFLPFGITDTPDMYYRVTGLGLNAVMDIIRLGSFSIAVSGGGFLNYSRGLIGTGGWPEEGHDSSDYFWRLYYGGSLGGGIRINGPDSRLIYEFFPLNFQFGPNYYLLAYTRFSVGIKIFEKAGL
jgi:hypothetical protein